MNKFNEIRPIVLGIATRDNKLLVGEGTKEDGTHFYRCLGGGIEFLEKSDEALRREFREELNAEIIINEFRGIAENIFVYEGKDAHELVLFYNIEIPDEYYKEEYHILDEDDGGRTIWVDIDDFKSGKKILYPEKMMDLL